MTVAQAKDEHPHISRFRVLRVLGQGGEGVVYLAADPKLGREVAIKTLTVGRAPEQLLDAARTVSTLSHPNIVPVFEVGMHEDRPFVVFEYVDGETLADLLEADGALTMARAVVMMSQILAGVAHVHASGVLHGDLKPANILIGANGIPRVTDFGISRRAHSAAVESVSAGTIRYMAPECFSQGRADYRADVFALGLIFHEMLSGEPVITGKNRFAQIHQVKHLSAQPPSAKNPRIAQEIDTIVLKALAKDPLARYDDAKAMKLELDRFRVPAANEARVDIAEQPLHSTVEFLLRRMAHKSDFPALSASFSRINQISAMGDEASTKALSDLILRDFALTQKLLRVANSAAFGAGKITKVSQAITLLGLAQLRSVATGMMLAGRNIPERQSAAIAAELTDAFVAGVISRNIGRMIGLAAVEELFICGMFSRLGQLLSMYYLGDEYQEIESRMKINAEDCAVASRAVLGISCEQLAAAVARKWNFPEVIVDSMAPLPAGELAAGSEESKRMWHCAGYARELCERLRRARSDDLQATLEQHIGRFAPVVPIEVDQVRALLTHSVELALKYVAASELASPNTALLATLEALRTDRAAAPPGAIPQAASAHPPADARPEQTVRHSASVSGPVVTAPQRSGFTSRIAQAWRSLF
jgi:serine/threonine protein kinase